MRQLQWLGAASVIFFLLPGAVSGQTDSTASTDSTATSDSSVTPAAAPAAPLVGNLWAVGGDLRFKSISVGGSHACGLTAEGKAYCWGKNTVGQLGDSTTTDRQEPVPVSAGLTFKTISAGGLHTCGIAADTHQPYCWGSNVDGQLGDGTRVRHPYPFLVAGEMAMTSIFAGPQHTCGTLKHWEKEGQAMCWGSNQDGQLGDMSTETSSLPIAPFGVIRYVSLALGDGHSCGATREGRVFCWGTNKRGQLGNGSATESRVPFITRMNRKSDFTMVAAGSAHTCALSGTGDVICWGDNTDGQVGTGSKGARVLSPAGIREAGSASAIYATGNTTCALLKDATIACWGSNGGGLFGATDVQGSRTPSPAFAGAGLKTMSLGRGWGCGLRADGSAVCWGTPAPTGN